MRGMHVDALTGFHLDPAIRDPAACKYERMRIASVDNRQLDIAVIRCAGYRLPFHTNFVLRSGVRALI